MKDAVITRGGIGHAHLHRRQGRAVQGGGRVGGRGFGGAGGGRKVCGDGLEAEGGQRWRGTGERERGGEGGEQVGRQCAEGQVVAEGRGGRKVGEDEDNVLIEKIERSV